MWSVRDGSIHRIPRVASNPEDLLVGVIACGEKNGDGLRTWRGEDGPVGGTLDHSHRGTRCRESSMSF